MALKAFVANLEDVPEVLREHYEKDGDKFVLKAEGLVDKAKLDEFRNNNVELMKRLDALKDVDPAEYKKMKAEVEAAREAAAKADPKKLEELLAERTASMRQTLDGQITTLSRTNESLAKRLEVVLVDNALQVAAVEAGVTDTALEDVVRRGRDVFRLKDDKVLPYHGESVKYGADGVTPMSMKEWLAGLATAAPHLFKQSKGGGADNGGGRGGKQTPSPAAGSKLSPTERLKHARRQGATSQH